MKSYSILFLRFLSLCMEDIRLFFSLHARRKSALRIEAKIVELELKLERTKKDVNHQLFIHRL